MKTKWLGLVLASVMALETHAQIPANLNTNELTAAIAELQKQIAQPDATTSPVFVNAPNTAERVAAAERARQAALAARQSVD
jgi:hypothetical protein